MKKLTFAMICKSKRHNPFFHFEHHFETCEEGSLWYVGSVAHHYAFQHTATDGNFNEEEYMAIEGV